MIFRALLLPAFCLALLLAGCQPSESPEYKEALAELRKVTLEHCDLTGKALTASLSNDLDSLGPLDEANNLAKSRMDKLLDRVVQLRPRRPDPTKYAEVIKDFDEVDEQFELARASIPRTVEEVTGYIDSYRNLITKFQDLNELVQIHKPKD